MHIEMTLFDKSVIALQADTQNFQLARQRVRNDKHTGSNTTEWEAFSFHPTLDHALNKLATLKVRSSAAKSLAELKLDIETVRREIKEAWGVSHGK